MIRETCLVTGATSGIGRAAAVSLAKKGYRVILVGRDEKRSSRTAEDIRRRSGHEDVAFSVCDLSLLRDVRALAARIQNDFGRIDVLVNNAGARYLRHGLTDEGIERTLATNHLGHFTLTLSLIGALERADRPRIINVSSVAHFAGAGVIENIRSADLYDGHKQYADSKLANVLFTLALADRLREKGVAVNAVDPGGVATRFGRNDGWVPWLKHRIYYLAKGRLLSPEQGASAIIFLASSEEAAGLTGKYFRQGLETRPSGLALDRSAQNALWAASVALSGMNAS